MIDQVRASLSNLSKSERAVAEAILADPEHSVHLASLVWLWQRVYPNPPWIVSAGHSVVVVFLILS